MKNQTLIEKIKKAAEADEKKRKDLRYKRAMAFLVRKGFLKTNADFAKYYQAKIKAADLIWAGQNVEPRILEVLPAAALRFKKAIKIEGIEKVEINLKNTMEDLASNKEVGHDFLNMPYNKIKVWMNLRLTDKRTKTTNEKLMRTFRLSPQTINRIEQLRSEQGFATDTALIEHLVNNSSATN